LFDVTKYSKTLSGKIKGYVYEYPGGSIKLEKSSEEAALREHFEETGLECDDVKATID